MHCWTVLSLFILIQSAGLCHGVVLPTVDYKCRDDAETMVVSTLNIKMPGVAPHQDDQYLCTSTKVPKEPNYLVQFEANATADTAHHILLFGCKEPFSSAGFWSCGSICKSGQSTIIFAWGKNALPTKLPCGVGFRIGEKYGITSLVMQIHYAEKFSANQKPDHSGLQLYLTKQSQKFVAGIFLLVSGTGVIPGNKAVVHTDVSCKYKGKRSIYPFAYRTHAHKLSVVITGYKYNGTWFEIGKGNPQWPQAFYPVKTVYEVKPSDYLVVRCTYNSIGRNRITYMGPTHTDEMCNFYMMFYTDLNIKDPFMECDDDQEYQIANSMPADSDRPLPFNPLLEERAKGKKGFPHHSSKIAPNLGNRISSSIFQLHKGKDVLSQQLAKDYQIEGNKDSFPLTNRLYQQLYSRQHDFGHFPHEALKRFDSEKYKNYLNEISHRENAPNIGSSNTRYPKSRNRNKVFQALNKQFLSSPQSARPSSLDVAKAGQNQKKLKVLTSSFSHTTPMVLRSSVQSAAESPDILINVKFVSNWPQKAALMKASLGQVGGVSVDNEENVYVFHRGSRVWNSHSFNEFDVFQYQEAPISEPAIVVFDKDGNLLDQWGENMFFMPHGVTVDQNGSLWLTDVALHQVLRFPKGLKTADLVLGQRFVPDNDDRYFCKPAAVAVMSSGEFFVADGYCNNRIMKFSKNGTFLKKWGQKDASVGPDGYPPPGTFFLVHDVTVAEDKGLVCAADRENGRIQCFDLEGNFRQQIHLKEFGSKLYGVKYCSKHGGMLFAVNGPSKLIVKPSQGFIIDINTGRLITTWNTPQGFKTPHGIAVDVNKNAVYVGELNPPHVWKFNVKIKQNLPVKKEEIPKPNIGPYSDTFSVTKNSKNQIMDKNADIQSLIIGILLVVPIVLVVVVTILIRLYNSGNLFCCNNAWRSRRKSYFGTFLTNSHAGFDKLSMEESDHEIDPLNDSDQEDFRISRKT